MIFFTTVLHVALKSQVNSCPDLEPSIHVPTLSKK